jgi:predicted AAA+ superfamily ATPase
MEEIYVHRELEEQVNRYLAAREIIAIVGPRQCGKTTLLRNIAKRLENVNFLDFEDRETLELFDKDINGFADIHVKGYKYLFIDEFQHARDGGKNLKYLFDRFTTKMIISGSSVSELTIHSIKHLVGRIFVFTLYPFSFSEFLSYKDARLYAHYRDNARLSQQIVSNLNRLHKEYLIYGGYPRVVLSEKTEEKEIVLKNIYNTYLLKDIKEAPHIADDYKIARLAHALALQLCGAINHSELCSVVGMHHAELLKNLNVLSKTFVTAESRPFSTNKRVEIVKSPKIYFIDNGFRNAIIKNFQNVHDRTDKGQLHENFVATELVKKGIELKHWRTRSKAEIDFVIDSNGEIIPLEVKSVLSEERIPKSIHSFADKYAPKRAIILSEDLDSSAKTGNTKIEFRPLVMVSKIFGQNG